MPIDPKSLRARGLISDAAFQTMPQAPHAALVTPQGATLGGTPSGGGARLPVRAPREDIHDVAASNFTFGKPIGNKTVPIESLKGGVGPAANDAARVSDLAAKMQSQDGYIERLIVDDAGNVLEGQHRLDALRQIGQTQAPVTVIKDLSRGLDVDAMRGAVKQSAGPMRSDQVNQLVGHALDAIHEHGDPATAAANTVIPGQWDAPYKAALGAAQPAGGGE